MRARKERARKKRARKERAYKERARRQEKTPHVYYKGKNMRNSLSDFSGQYREISSLLPTFP